MEEKEKLVKHLDAKFQEAGGNRDYEEAAKIHAELNAAKAHIEQLQTDFAAASAAVVDAPVIDGVSETS